MRELIKILMQISPNDNQWTWIGQERRFHEMRVQPRQQRTSNVTSTWKDRWSEKVIRHSGFPHNLLQFIASAQETCRRIALENIFSRSPVSLIASSRNWIPGLKTGFRRPQGIWFINGLPRATIYDGCRGSGCFHLIFCVHYLASLLIYSTAEEEDKLGVLGLN